jgi:hypothetical protein
MFKTLAYNICDRKILENIFILQTFIEFSKVYVQVYITLWPQLTLWLQDSKK